MTTPPGHLGDEVEGLKSIQPGQSVAVFYSDDTYWHERIYLWKDKGSCHYIVTPDEDVYSEDFSADPSDGPSRFKIKGRDFPYWSSLRAPVYRFRQAPTDEKLRQYVGMAIQDMGSRVFEPGAWRPQYILTSKGEEVSPSAFLGRLLVPRRITRGTGGVLEEPQGEAEIVPEDVHHVRRPPDTHIWISEEKVGDVELGEEIPYPPTKAIGVGDSAGLACVRGQWVRISLRKVVDVPGYVEARRGEMSRYLSAIPRAPVVEVADSKKDKVLSEEVHEDARTLSVDFDEQGERFKSFKQATQEAQEYSFSDWPHEGPQSTLHLMKAMHRSGGDAKLWLQVWARHRGISENDRVMFELRTLIEVIQYGACYDQLNIASLASFESVSRRIQSIVDAYASGAAGAPDWGAARIISGYKGPDDVISSQLRTWAAKRGKEEVELIQARQKMKDGRRSLLIPEESALAVAEGALPAGASPKPGPKKKGTGKGLAPPPQT
eukprot:s335_g6.t1